MKPKREITLGEMQDECKKRGRCRAIDKVVDKCPYASICIDTMAHCEEACDGSEYDVFTNPCDWNLTDPPRFTEAQMELLRAAKSVGFKIAYNGVYGLYFDGSGTVVEAFGMKHGETLDLAELFGKEGEK